MNTHYVEPKTQPTHRSSNYLQLLRPVAGAMIGWILFLLPTSPFLLSEIGIIKDGFYSSPLWSFDAVLLGPGLLVFFITGSILDSLGLINPRNSSFFTFEAASIPSVIIGFLIGSQRKNLRIAGIIILVLYVLILGFGFPLWQMIWSA